LQVTVLSPLKGTIDMRVGTRNTDTNRDYWRDFFPYAATRSFFATCIVVLGQ